jgi:hypothetical protein
LRLVFADCNQYSSVAPRQSPVITVLDQGLLEKASFDPALARRVSG